MAELQLVVFRLGHEQFAAPITRVREILRPLKVTRMPRTASYVRGLFNLRGQVLPLVDTKARLGMKASSPEVAAQGKDPSRPAEGPAGASGQAAKARVMVLEAGGENVGLMVDEVLEVLRCDDSALQAPRNVLDSAAGRFLAAVLDLEGRLVLVLDLDRLVEGAAEAA